jgi:hypothetical protein
VRVPADVLVPQVARDQVRDVRVADGDEIAARRIERIEEHAGLARQRPAIGREYLLAAVGEIAQETEVLQQMALAFDGLGQARLVLAKPFERLLEGVHGFQRMQPGVADYAHGMRTRRQRDQPCPITFAAQMIGGQPAMRRIATLQPLLVGDPVIDIDAAAHAKPDGVGVMRIVLREIQLALDQAGAARCIDQPAAVDFMRLARRFVADLMRGRRRAQIEAAHHRAVNKTDAALAHQFAQVVLEDAAVELIAGRGESAAGAELHDSLQVVTTFGKEKPEAEFPELSPREVLLQTEHGIEIVPADLHRGLAHLVRGLGHGMVPAFQHQHIELGKLLPQLDRERQAGESATEDDHVVLCVMHGVFLQSF